MALLTLESYDYSEDYLKDIEIEHFDESMSDMDCCMYIISEGERMWNDIMKEMAVNELRHLAENGTEMIYEAADTDNFFKGIINWFKEKAGQIAGWIQKKFRDIQDHLDKFKKYANKYEKDIKKGYNLIPSDGIKMKTFYKFPNLEGSSKDKNLEELKKLVDSKLQGEYGLDFITGNSKDISKEDIKEYIDMLQDRSNVTSSMNTIRAQIVGKGSGSVEAKDFKKELKTFYYGEPIKDKVTASDIDINKVMDDLKSCTGWKRNVSDAHKEFKKLINGYINEVNRFKKNIDKSDDTREAKMSYCKNVVQIYKQFINISSVMKAVKLSAFGTRARQSLAVSKHLVALAKKAEGGDKKKEEKIGESFTYQFEDGMNFFTSDLL